MVILNQGRYGENITTIKYLKDYQDKERQTYCVVLKKAKPKPKTRTDRETNFSLNIQVLKNDKRCSVKSKGLKSLGMFKHSDHRLGARSYPCWVNAKIHSNRNFTNLWIMSDRNWSWICLESRKGFGLLEFVLVEPNGRDVLGLGATNKTEKIYCSQDSSVGQI